MIVASGFSKSFGVMLGSLLYAGSRECIVTCCILRLFARDLRRKVPTGYLTKEESSAEGQGSVQRDRWLGKGIRVNVRDTREVPHCNQKIIRLWLPLSLSPLEQSWPLALNLSFK